MFKLREGLNWDTEFDDEVISKLTRDKIIARDYIDRSFRLLVPFYEDDDGVFEKQYNDISVNNIEERIDEYRILFKGYRVGNMGNKRNCIEAVTRFIILNRVTFDDILHAARYYIQNTEPKFITNAENFIYKVTDKGEVSKLYDMLEELQSHESNLL